MEQFRIRAGQVDLERRQVSRGEDTVILSTIETELLRWMVDRADAVVDRDTLLVEVWGFPKPVMTRAVDNTMMRLRRKIEIDPAEPDHLVTIRGRGYSFVPLPADSEAHTSPRPDHLTLRATPRGFFGRQAELAELDRATAAHRWVTVLGAGGIGKTSLVRAWSRQRPHLLWCDLSATADEGDVRRAVAATIGAEAPSAQAIHTQLARHRGVLVLDNVEQVADAVAASVLGWLDQAPELVVVLTSRERLRTAAEHVLELRPLDQASAVALFRHRATAAGARLDPNDDEFIGDIVARLDRLPLAVELAAARARILPLRRLRDALSDALTTLRSTRRDLPARHQTVEACIDESWQALDASARRLLMTLSLLVDGFDLDLLDGVVNLGPQGPWVLDTLADLHDRSLIVARDGFDGDARLRTLEVVRQFSARQLAAFPEAELIEDTVLDWFTGRSTAWRAGIHTALPQASIEAMTRERQNLVALARRNATRRPQASAQIAYNLGWHLLNRVPDPEMLALGVEAADRAGHARLRVANRLLLGRQLEWSGRAAEAEALHEQALSLARREDPEQVAIACFHLASHESRRADVERAIRTSQEGLDAAAKFDKPIVGAMLCQRLGSVYTAGGRHREARPIFQRALAAYEDLGQDTAVPYARLSLGRNAVCLDDLPTGREEVRAALTQATALSLSRFSAVCRLELAWILLFDDDQDELRAQLDAFDSVVAKFGDPALRAGRDLLGAIRAMSQGHRPEPDAVRAARDSFATEQAHLWAGLADTLLHLLDGSAQPPDRGDPESQALARWARCLTQTQPEPPTNEPPAWMYQVGLTLHRGMKPD